MTNKIENAISKIQYLWQNLSIEAIDKIKAEISGVSSDTEVQQYLNESTREFPKGIELHRDPTEGFILLAYPEARGTYRVPHNHGEAWVIYAVISGEVEMGSYINSPKLDGSNRLILKSKERLLPGNTRIYFSGEIHDTLCVSEDALVLRLASGDLREEEKAGRMKRFEPLED